MWSVIENHENESGNELGAYIIKNIILITNLTLCILQDS
jgi:hypothetical protein